MTKQEYISDLENDIQRILGDFSLKNYKKQIFAWNLNAKFNRTYKEEYLWNRALFLSSNSCLIIQNEGKKKVAITALKESAEIYEYLSELSDISNKYDKEYLLILSAFCFDLAGYQANGYCIASRLKDYQFEAGEGQSVEGENLVIDQIRNILLKKIPFSEQSIKNNSYIVDSRLDVGVELFTNSLQKWYDYILHLKESDYLSIIHQAYKYYLNAGNSYLSLLLLMLETRMLVFEERGIWKNLKKNINIVNNSYWRKYVKLLAHDFYSLNSITAIQNRKSKFEFWTSQLRAIENGLLDLEENFVVQMPTSAGKTFVAELSILKYLVKFPDKKCIYIAPFRALTSEKEEEISHCFSKLGFSVSSLTGSYELDEFQDVILDQTDILIATPEKIDLLLRINPTFFNDISFIVIDEGHIVGDISSRASLLEFLIIRLRIKVPTIQTLFISAVMPAENANDYAVWLSGKKENVFRSLKFEDSSLADEWEPTRKLIGSFEWEGESGNITFQNVTIEDEKTKKERGAKVYSYLSEEEFGGIFLKKKEKKNSAAALAFKLSGEGNTLVFCAQFQRIKSVADSFLSIFSKLTKLNQEIPDRFLVNKDKESSHYADIWFGTDSFVTKAIDRGIGIHYGDMPEQVRNAVENDFRNGRLTVLLSTNTIGQGLNLPIKNLVFYETLIARINDENKYVQFRDFWNIVGRAGRAGVETEGKVLFIINSPNDRRLYKRFINKSNIEEANSLFFKVLDSLVGLRISEPRFDEFISLLSETYLLDIISEEILDTDFEEIVEKILNNSLFKVQIDKRGMDLKPIKASFIKKFTEFKEKAPYEQLSIYGNTGFSFRSNQIVDDYVIENKKRIQQILENDDYLALLDEYLELISTYKIDELQDYKLSKIELLPTSFSEVVKKWISGASLSEIREEWIKAGAQMEDFHVFLSKAIYFLYPWGITTFLTLISYRLGLETIQKNVKSLSSFLKFGLPNSTSCLARSLGIKSRQLSMLVYKESNFLEGKSFIRWLSNLGESEINNFDVPQFDKDNLKRVIVKLTTQNFRETSSSFQFSLKGIYFNARWRVNSRKVYIGERLIYMRDVKNEFDPFAIKVLKQGKIELGFVPKEYSKVISAEIDINNTQYEIIVRGIFEENEYNRVQVEMIAL